ncbi:MAG TPA: hypothetical protein VFP84_01025, partial [Kofleriaceae bacterium]|nr:hypothetical protein [Kofleriaceae bacterium]
MANDENTAVNDLIARLHGGQPDPDFDPEMGVTTMQTTLPFKMPVAAPFDAPYPVPTARSAAMPAVHGQGTGPQAKNAPPPRLPRSPAEEPAWAPSATLNAPRPRGQSPESFVGTVRVRHGSERQVMFNRLVIPVALLVVVGMLVGGWIAMHGERAPIADRRAALAAAPAPAPRAASPPPRRPRAASPRPPAPAPLAA